MRLVAGLGPDALGVGAIALPQTPTGPLAVIGGGVKGDWKGEGRGREGRKEREREGFSLPYLLGG